MQQFTADLQEAGIETKLPFAVRVKASLLVRDRRKERQIYIFRISQGEGQRAIALPIGNRMGRGLAPVLVYAPR